MSDPVDHHARERADQAKDLAVEARAKANETAKQIEMHLQDCRDRNRRHETFEAEMRAGMSNLQEGISASVRRVHERIDGITNEITTLKSGLARQQGIWTLAQTVITAVVVYAITKGLE